MEIEIPEAWGFFTALLVAMLGYFLQHLYDLRLQRRQDQLERVNQQLRNFYGPLYAIISVTKDCYSWFLKRNSPTRGSDTKAVTALRRVIKEKPDGKAARRYRAWMREILMPLNVRASELLIDNADLFDASTMPKFFLDMVTHVECSKLVMKQWEQGDFSDHFPGTPYPHEIHFYVMMEFGRLKRLQTMLLSGTDSDEHDNSASALEPEEGVQVDFGPRDPRKVRRLSGQELEGMRKTLASMHRSTVKSSRSIGSELMHSTRSLFPSPSPNDLLGRATSAPDLSHALSKPTRRRTKRR